MMLNNYSAVQCFAFILSIYTTINCVASNEYFSSTAGLEKLLKTEGILLKDFRKYVDLKKAFIDGLESELLRMEEQHKLALSNSDDYLTNPINVYLLMKRLHSDWYSYQERIRNDNVGAKFIERLETHKATLDYPDEYDLYGAAIALMRLQSIYKLDVADIAAGKLNGIQYNAKMSWHDCYELGRQLHAAEAYSFTKLWLNEAMRLLGKENFAQEAKALDIYESVAQTLFDLGDVQAAYNISRSVIEINSDRIRALDIIRKSKNVLKNAEKTRNIPVENFWSNAYYHSDEYKKYEELCRIDLIPTPRQQRPLRCRYVTNKISFRILAPFKVEEHSLDPLIMTIHDVITAKKADAIKEIATPYLERSTVRAPGKAMSSNIRVSKNAWIEYQEHAYTLQMLWELHDLTGLDVSMCEALQVANYGLGGHYEPHWDFYLPEEISQIPENEGNRIATAIFYLTDVAQGGATVFPHVNVTVWPHKGSVLFWYNLHRSLDRDYRTLHAGCPVLKGNKWIGNVWINDVTQTFSRPCLRQRDHEKSLSCQKRI